MSDRYIHTREIEEYLYCPKRWKQNKKSFIRSDKEFEEAIRVRNRVREYCAPTLPNEPLYDQVKYPKHPIDIPPIISRIIVFFIFTFTIFGVFGVYDNIFMNFSIIICTIFGPHIIYFIQRKIYNYRFEKAQEIVNDMQMHHQAKVQRVLQEAEQSKRRFLEEYKSFKTIFLTEEYQEVLKDSKNEFLESINQEFKFYDDEMNIELNEEYKTCWVIFDRSNENIPTYVPIGHKYHFIRLVAQMLIAQNYFIGYKVYGSIRYKNRKPRRYNLDRKSSFALNQVLRNIHQNADWYFDNTYRCVHCPLLERCKYAKKEAYDYFERVGAQ